MLTERDSKSGQIALNEKEFALWHKWWKDGETFIASASSAGGRRLLDKPYNAWSKPYPTLAKVAELFKEPQPFKEVNEYGQTTIKYLTGVDICWKFIKSHLANYLLTTPKGIPSDEALDEMAQDIASVMIPYTIAEIMLFFALLRSGRWKMYNKDSIQEMLEIFRHEFLPYRSSMIDDVNSIKSNIAYEEHKAKSVTWEQAQEMARQGLLPPFQNLTLIDFINEK